MDRFPSLHSLKMNLYFKHQTPLLLEQLILVLKKVPTRIHTMMHLHIMKKVPQQVELQVAQPRVEVIQEEQLEVEQLQGGTTTGGTTTGGGSTTGGSSGGSNAGMLTGLVEMAVQYYAIPELSPDGNNPMITASFTNHSGTYGSWQTWIPPVGGCQNHVALSIPHLANGTSVGSSVTFTSTQSSFILPSTIDQYGGTTYTSPLSIYQIGANHSYAIDLPTGENIPGAISLPSDFISFVPIEPFTSSNIFGTPISVNNFALQWTANTPPAEILVILESF